MHWQTLYTAKHSNIFGTKCATLNLKTDYDILNQANSNCQIWRKAKDRTSSNSKDIEGRGPTLNIDVIQLLSTKL